MNLFAKIMGFFDGLFGTINNLNPLNQGASLVKTVILSIVVLIVLFMIWITFLAKSNMVAAPGTAKRMFGVIPGWKSKP